MSFKISSKTMMYWLIILIIFLPRSLYIAGMYSFRFPIVLGLLITLFNKDFQVSLKGFIRNPFIWFYFIYTCSRYSITGRISTGFGMVIDSIFVLYCSIESIGSVYDLKKFCNIFTNVMNIYCILGLVECLTGFNLWATITNSTLIGIRYGLHRTYGSFENYMNNGTFLVLSLAIVMWGIQNVKKRKFTVTYVLVLLNIFSTITRASIIGAIVLQCLWLIKAGVLKSLKRHFKSVLLICIVLVVVLQLPQVKVIMQAITNMFLAVLDPSLAIEIASSFGGNAKGTGQRLDLYTWVWQSIDNKWLGAGPATVFGYEWVTSTGATALKWSIENQGLAVLFKYGLSGLAFYIAMMLSVIRDTVKAGRLESAKLEEEHKLRFTLSFLVTSTILVYILMGFFHAYLSEFRFFFILIGFLSGYVNVLKSGDMNFN